MATDSAARPRVLIADEDAGTRLHVQQILSGAYEVHAVGDGETALASAREHSPDLVLADTIMPRLDGIGLLRALRDDPGTRDIPIILLSDPANEGSRFDALKAGAADYLLKPLSAPDLLVRVDARLEIARLRRKLLDLERKSTAPTIEDAETEFARKSNRLRRARNSLQRELSSRTEEVSQLNQELIADRQTLLSLKDELAGELAAMNRLHELSQLLDHIEIQPLLKEVLEASMALLNADFGNVQLYDPKSHALKIVVQRGFEQDFLDYFDNVQEGTASCGTALERRERVIVEDVLTDPVFAQHLPIINAAGYRAVQSTPLIGRGGEILGMISTHFRQPHRPSERELRFVDLYARQAAEMIERKRAKAALLAAKEEAERRAREAEEAQSILQAIMEYAPEGITLTGGPPDFPIIANSKHVAQMIGRNAETLLNIPAGWHAEAYGLLLPDGTRPRPEQLPLYRASRHGEVIKNEEWIIERPDGSRIHELSNCAPIRDSQGRVIGAINCWHEIAELKRAEEALRATEEHFRRYFELGLIGMAMTSPTKGILEVNNELCRILGYERDELLQKTWAEITHPDDLAADVAQFKRVIAGEIDGYSLDKRWIRKDGALIDSIMSAQCMRRADGSVEYFVGLVLDTTERRRAEEKLQRDMILESISDNFFGLSSDGRFTYFNKHAAKQMEILGKDPAHLIGKVAWEEFPDMPNKENVQRVLTERVPITDELYYAPLGEWVENHMYPSHDGGLVTFQRYITVRKRTEEELRKAQAELAHVTRVMTMGELAASIAHEINQPLGAIVNNGNVAIRIATAENPSHDKLVEVLSDIVADANRASAIISRIRAVMRKSAPEKTSLQPKDVVVAVLALVQRELAARRIKVRTELPEDLPSVAGDRVQLQQVLLNLVMNGIDAMSEVEEARRVLTISGRRDELAGQPAVLIAVRDFGSGFSREDYERFFDAFYTTKPSGMGMGLRISRSIAEAHGGRVWAISNKGQGATFYCALPIDN